MSSRKGPALSGVQANAIGARAVGLRLERNTATQLQAIDYIGNRTWVNGLYVAHNPINLNITDNLLTAAGAEDVAAMAASTLYYIYVSNSRVPYRASSLGASLTAPSRANGILSLGGTGDAVNWRFIGYVRTNAVPEFVDTVTDRGVSNYYNKRPLTLEARPGYVDDNLASSFTHSNTAWAQANGGTGSRVSFIANGEDAVEFEFPASESGVAVAGHFGVGIDTTTDCHSGVVTLNDSSYQGTCGTYKFVPAQGYHTADLMNVLNGVLVATTFADDGRKGAVADVPLTYLRGVVLG